jgi:hypothetical protein
MRYLCWKFVKIGSIVSIIWLHLILVQDYTVLLHDRCASIKTLMFQKSSIKEWTDGLLINYFYCVYLIKIYDFSNCTLLENKE